MSATVLHIAGDDLDLVNGFRKSFNREHQTFTEADAGLIHRGMVDGHTEPSRHAWAKFGIECSIGCARQIMTHKRYLAISEHSTRYSEMPEAFVMPPLKRQVGKAMDYRFESSDAETLARWEARIQAHYDAGHALYREMLADGIAREDARYVLSLGQRTALIASGDLVAWLRFLARRTNPHAQDEVRAIARRIEAELRGAFPHTLAAWDAAGRVAL